MRFKVWESTSYPVMYHGSPTKQTQLQPGSMLTTDILWACGYTTTITHNPKWKEKVTGVIQVVHPNPKNEFIVNASLHGTEEYLIKLCKNIGGGLPACARAVHEKYGYDALIANFRGEKVGMITLVPLLVDTFIDPMKVLLKSDLNSIATNLQKVVQDYRFENPSDYA